MYTNKSKIQYNVVFPQSFKEGHALFTSLVRQESTHLNFREHKKQAKTERFHLIGEKQLVLT